MQAFRALFPLTCALLLVVASPATVLGQPTDRGGAPAGVQADRERSETASLRATSASTDHLDVDAWASEDTLAPGDQASLVLDVRPRPKMHVYAPGAEADGYRVITLTLTEAPWVDADAATFPPSEIYYFEPLDEQVPVYSLPFQVTREITLQTSEEARAALADRDTLVIEGQLDYQACDDRVCHRPVTLPVSWSFTLEP